MNAPNHPRGGASSQGRGRGGRFRRDFNNRNPSSPSVPSVQQVTVGAPVSIVLKVDQPTGHEVQGIVAELLTNGNHPRGLKVRLQDGRVGRVQGMASEETAKAGSEGLSGLGENGERLSGMGVMVAPAAAVRGGFSGVRYNDFRVDSPDEPPSIELSLEDYVVVKQKGKKGKRRGGKKGQEVDSSIQGGATEETSATNSTTISTTKCPVCNEFEGDEAAMAHHVNEHFD